MTPLEKAKTSKTFCIYPWIHQYIGPPGDVKPCCNYLQNEQIGSMKENTLEEIWNNDATKQMRLDMLNGVEVSGCAICNLRQGIVHKTYRDDANENFFTEDTHDIINNTLNDGTLPEHKLLYMDARWNNLCNLKCRTCGPRFSTSWIDEHAKLYNLTKEDRLKTEDVFTFSGKYEDQLYEEMEKHLPYVKRIYFAGGEPLMQKDHYKVLEKLIHLGHTGTDGKPLTIHYNTNFSQLKLGKYQAIDLWKQFKDINIHASLDASHDKAEYWRKGTDWDIIVENRERLIRECPNVSFKISFTLSWVNAYNMCNFYKEWVIKEYIKPNHFLINLLDVPKHYCLKSIPTWKKNKIRKEFMDLISWIDKRKGPLQRIYPVHMINKITDAIAFMYSVDSGDEFLHKEDLLKIQSKLDLIRNENFWEMFPEHVDIKEFLNV